MIMGVTRRRGTMQNLIYTHINRTVAQVWGLYAVRVMMMVMMRRRWRNMRRMVAKDSK